MITELRNPTPEAIRRAAELIRRGEVVGFPTETVYGLGADGLNEGAVEKIFQAKGRPGDNPLILHIAELSELAPLILGEPNAAAKALMAAHWPGPLTMIFPKSALVPDRATAGLPTVAIRMPSHPVARELIRLAGTPIAAPSANRSGRPSPTTAADVLEDMDGRIPLILDGGQCEVGLESTVVDLTGGVPRVLRPGFVTAAEIKSAAGGSEIDPAVLAPLSEGEAPRSPGMKYRHYAPMGEVTAFRGPGAVGEIARRYDQADNALILALEENVPRYGNRCVLSLGRDESAMASTLFRALREADRLKAEHIFCECVEPEGVGLAVMNRLLRAAAFNVIDT
ncbi:MAG: threonylcarbamoyl-AMP synthase [Clostridiales bacterium]|jgi:L-threonylcarbamoyladenylate synthase|nr:threonylcarbamoyl-AMP synthase [Clostridiales bacterium]